MAGQKAKTAEEIQREDCARDWHTWTMKYLGTKVAEFRCTACGKETGAVELLA